MEHQDGLAIGRGAGEVEIEGVEFGDAGMVAAEGVGVMAIDGEQRRQYVVAVAIARGGGVDAVVGAVQTEFGEGRRFELFVGDDLGVRGMVQGHELDLIDVGDFAQFLGHTDLVEAVARAQEGGGDGDVLLVIDGEVLAVAGACAQGATPQHVGDELEAVSRSR